SSHIIWKTSNRSILELIHDIIGTYVNSKFHGNWTINVASRAHCAQVSLKSLSRSPIHTATVLCYIKTFDNK
ncbi:hypothetical protein DPMN_099628, partial [Dreissena polymorpha]